MSKRIGNVTLICAEDDDLCQECGKVDEVRPYGENGKKICYDCGMKNPELTEKMMNHILFGDPLKLTKEN